MLADECSPQCTTLAQFFGLISENLETMLGKTLNQSRAGPEDEELPEIGNWTRNCTPTFPSVTDLKIESGNGAS